MGSNGDMAARSDHVRFTPDSGSRGSMPSARWTFRPNAEAGRILHNPGPIQSARAFWRGSNDGVDHGGVERAMDRLLAAMPLLSAL
jgi:hypothetical protein